MLKKITSCVLCLLTLCSVCLSFAGCSSSDGNFPVTVSHTKISQKPEKVVVLSDNLADIVYYLGYSTQIAALSDSCTQEELTRYIGSVGSEDNPDAEKIIASGAKYVLTEKPLPEETANALKENGIEVMLHLIPTDEEMLKALYLTLGKIFGGKTDGAQMGESSYNRLTKTLSQAESQVESATVVSFCYLYMNEAGILSSFPYNKTLPTQEGYFLNYLAATNVATNFTELKVDQDILKISNPDFIFYDDETVLNYLKDSSTLHNMSALKNSRTYMLPKEALSRQGNTMLSTQQFMLSKMFPGIVSPEATGESLQKLYGIELNKDMKYEEGSDDANVKIVQQRLVDLGYLKLAEGDSPTTYYGSMTAAAVKDFQSKNGLEATGIADFKTLEVLFNSTTLSANGTPYIPNSQGTPEAPTSAPSEPETKPSSSGSVTPSGYNITFTPDTVYKEGDESEDIRVIQQRLVDIRYISFDEGDSPTTYYGSGTKNSITMFQEDNGLEATGIADYKTLKALFDVE